MYDALRSGIATSASLMVPCPWAREAAARYRGEDVGVHLTLNAEWDLYRWGPITHAPSLLDGDGASPAPWTNWAHADIGRSPRWRARWARHFWLDVSHLAHMGALNSGPIPRRLPA